MNSDQSSHNLIMTTVNSDSINQSLSIANMNRTRSNNNKKSKSENNESLILQESHPNSSHTDILTTTATNILNDSLSNDMEDDRILPTMYKTINNCAKKNSSKKSKINNDTKACR